jgi:hypothetical protein
MAKKRIITVKLEKINISYMCGEIPTSIDISTDDIHSSESECELCGSHGSMSIWINKCPQCGKYHDIEVKEW